MYIASHGRYRARLEALPPAPHRLRAGAPPEPRTRVSPSPRRCTGRSLASHPDFRAHRPRHVPGRLRRARRPSARRRWLIPAPHRASTRVAAFGDAWMMVGEHHFVRANWQEARDAYANVLERPRPRRLRPRAVQDRVVRLEARRHRARGRALQGGARPRAEAERTGTARSAGAARQLRDEALEYLVVVFTEDESITAKDAFDFLASIGGERYSRDVLVKLADTFFDQAAYERATDSLSLPHRAGSRATRRGRPTSAGSSRPALARSTTDEARRRMPRCWPTSYGPGSAWAKANQRNREALTPSARPPTEELARAIGEATATPRRRPTRRRRKKPDLAPLRARRRRSTPSTCRRSAPAPRRRRRGPLPARPTSSSSSSGKLRGGRRRVPGRRQDRAGRQAPQGRAAQGDGARSRRRARKDRRASAASSCRSTRSSPRRSTSTRRCSPPTRRSSASSTRTASCSSTTATTTRRSSASA